MKYNFKDSMEILSRTPVTLDTLLRDLPDEWTQSNEGPDTWSPYDVLGHLIHGERTDWISRIEIILSDEGEKKFTPFDRFAQFEESKGKSMNDLLDDFKIVRERNLSIVKSMKLIESDLERKSIHPVFGEVTLRNLLSTWMVHDYDHIFQIVRVMSVQYLTEIGPWKEYMGIVK